MVSRASYQLGEETRKTIVSGSRIRPEHINKETRALYYLLITVPE